jgi:hypothetical protein
LIFHTIVVGSDMEIPDAEDRQCSGCTPEAAQKQMLEWAATKWQKAGFLRLPPRHESECSRMLWIPREPFRKAEHEWTMQHLAGSSFYPQIYIVGLCKECAAKEEAFRKELQRLAAHDDDIPLGGQR